MQQLHTKDDAEIYDVRKQQSIKIKQFRLVSRGVADALTCTYPWEKLFLAWGEFQVRRKAVMSLARSDNLRFRQVEQTESPDSDEGGAA